MRMVCLLIVIACRDPCTSSRDLCWVSYLLNDCYRDIGTKVCSFWEPKETGWWQLKYLFCSSLPREMIQFDENIFQMG